MDWGRTLQGKKIRGRRNSLEHLRRRLDGEADADAGAPHPSTAHPGVTSHGQGQGQGQADALVGFPVPLPLLQSGARGTHRDTHAYNTGSMGENGCTWIFFSSMIVF